MPAIDRKGISDQITSQPRRLGAAHGKPNYWQAWVICSMEAGAAPSHLTTCMAAELR
jgi:hypothetical protein